MANKRVNTLRASLICCVILAITPAYAELAQIDTITNTQVPLTNLVSEQKNITAPEILKSRQQLQGWLSPGTNLVYMDRLAKLYAENNMQPLWDDEPAVLEFKQQLAELALAGFQPQFGKWLSLLVKNKQLNQMERDVILSDAMLGYLYFICNVKYNGKDWLYQKTPFQLREPTIGGVSQWQTAINSKQLASWIKTLAPQHASYLPMRTKMLAYLADQQIWPKINTVSLLKPGQTSNDLVSLSEILTRNGLLTQDADTDENSRNYGGLLVDAVKQFQRMYGLEPDGIIGNATLKWLNTSPTDRAGLLAINIQRLRIIPNEGGSGILVNIPAYTLHFYLNNQLIIDSKVIVGRPDRKTPIMSSELNSVVINPPWNVPTSMVRKDILPQARRDPGYFARRGFTVLSGWERNAYPIDPYSINWNAISSSSFPYRVRQAPGPANALGRYKFNMPSSDAIYLHDTPNHSLFNRQNRSISSGCVRVNKASVLASILLARASWDQKRIDGALQLGETRYINIPGRIPIYLYYQTAWVDNKNIANFRDDIYGYDNVIYGAMNYLNEIKTTLNE
ncbi:L,D-transpeptidase [Arsenophonus sp. aPb]|uniref:L,D-transpeptidase n=1 Tax=Arsenophonus sp. aPb TaxID=3041619 RepID=UPI002469A00A|nr:L,D-transpeptidase [Arsenophonus sp. aPb]WGL99294.1 L,D-transpeptidase [Arsenophonus sp. aPb]